MSNLVQAQKISPAAVEQAPRPESEFRRVVRLMGRFLVGQRRLFVMAFVMLGAEAVTAIFAAYPLSYLIDFIKGDRPNLFQVFGLPAFVTPYIGTVAILTIAVVLMAMINSAADSMAEIYLARSGRMLGFNLRVGLYDHLQRLSLAFFNRQRTGDILTRVTSDVSALEDFMISSLSDIVGSLLVLIGTLAYLLYRSWEVALVAALIVPGVALVANHFAQRIKAVSKKQRAREGDLASAAQEMLTSIRVIQTYGRGGNELKSFAEQNQKTMDVALDAARIQAVFSWVVKVLEALSTIMIIWLGVWLISQSTITIGTLVLFTILIDQMFKPTKKIIKEWNTFGKMYASAERIGELLDRKPAVQNQPGAIEAPPLKGHVEYRNISFAYQVDPEDAKDGEPQMRLALRDVNLTIAPGQVVALVGGSGAGKSTFVQLLPRLYDPHLGQVLIDGHDIRSFTLESLRARMSMVLQETVLFSGTVAENIAYGRDNASREEVIAASMQANAHEFIEKLPKGYDTELGERASNLSGGQRQRLAIARAFIRNTSVLILDEPTTGLDAESTDLVLSALRTLMKGKSTIIISHDLNLIRNADKIAVVQQGEIVQTGTHRELLKTGGLYADLYHKQFGQAAEEQGRQIQPVVAPPVPIQSIIAPPAIQRLPDDIEEDDEPAELVTAKAFQTLMTKALPQPVSPKAFQTLMMQAVPLASAAPQAAKPAPQAAKPAAVTPAAVTPAPQAAKPAAPPAAVTPAPQAAKPAAPPAPATPAPQAAKPAAVTPAAVTPAPQAAKPAAVTPAAVTPAPQAAKPAAVTPAPQAAKPAAPPAPATPAPQAAKPAAPNTAEEAKHTPAIFATTVMHTIPAPATAGSHVQPTPQAIVPDAAQPATRQLDLRQSAVVQRELPGLQIAFDGAAMRGYLQTALFGKAHARYTIEHCTPGKAIYMGNCCTLRYELEIKDNTSGQTIQSVVGGRIFQDQLACAVYQRDKLAPLAVLIRNREEFAPFAAATGLVEPLNMVVHVFPIDGELPTLVNATDRQQMVAIFNDMLPDALADRFIAQDCRVTPVNYARRYRCVMRYEIDGGAPGNNKPQRRVVYGKVATDNRGALIGQVTAALQQHLAAKGPADQFAVPRSLGFRPDLQLSLLEAIPGTPRINQLLKARLNGAANGQDKGLSLEAAIDACARIACTLHTSNISLGRRRTLDGEFATLQHDIEMLRRVAPELGTRFQAWLEQIETYAEASDSLKPCFSHGDYTYSQLIFEGARSGLVDFDTICQAESALDLGQFLAYLRVAAHKARKAAADAAPIGEQLGARFVNTYIAAIGDRLEDVERLRVRIAVYEIVSLMRMALHSWQQIKPARLENALAVLEERIACLPQLDY